MNPTPLDSHWSFRLEDESTSRPVTLPHDWSIHGERTLDAPARGDGGYFPTGVGYYTRELTVASLWPDQRVFVEFEGVSGITEVFINDVSLGVHPYAFTPFRLELTPHLTAQGPNTLTVKVDNSNQPNCRWYSGSGLYRRVWLHRVPPVHIQSVFVETIALLENEAHLRVSIQTSSEVPPEAEVRLLNPNGSEFLAQRFQEAAILVVRKPQLWSPETPQLYTACFNLPGVENGAQEVTTTFGIRQLDWDAINGFQLNGKTIKLCGGNLHQDHGPLGTAVFERAEERRVEILKAAGFNALRTAHHPPSTAFLDVCDRLGMLVFAEAFDGWITHKLPHDYGTHFEAWWQLDVDAMVLRDRNHPSVIAWSIGNEVFERGKPKAAEISNALKERIKQWDNTRPVTIGLNGLGANQEWAELDRVFQPLDVAGYNYEILRHVEDHSRLPERVIISSESYLNDAFEGWAAAGGNSHVIGDFVWSAMDYLGEAGLGRVFAAGETATLPWEAPQFPWHGAMCGDIDITGWSKPTMHYRNIVWNRGETLYATVHCPAPGNRPWQVQRWAVPPTQASWTWPGHEGQVLPVEVYSRHEAVRLYLNGRLIGEQLTGVRQEFKTTFRVPYEPGSLVAVGIRDGEAVEHFTLETAGPATSLRLTADRMDFTTSGQDLCFVTVEVLDADGRVRPDAADTISYSLTGSGMIAGIANGDLSSDERYGTSQRRTFQGRALVIVRGFEPGHLELTASAPGLESATLRLHVTHAA